MFSLAVVRPTTASRSAGCGWYYGPMEPWDVDGRAVGGRGVTVDLGDYRNTWCGHSMSVHKSPGASVVEANVLVDRSMQGRTTSYGQGRRVIGAIKVIAGSAEVGEEME